MTYVSCCGNENYAQNQASSYEHSSSGYSNNSYARNSGPERVSNSYRLSSQETLQPEGNYLSSPSRKDAAPDAYSLGSGNPNYDPGINNVAAAHMRVPTCGEVKSIESFI